MTAELEYVGGKPVLRLEQRTRGYRTDKRTVVDLPLTPEQARVLQIHGVPLS